MMRRLVFSAVLSGIVVLGGLALPAGTPASATGTGKGICKTVKKGGKKQQVCSAMTLAKSLSAAVTAATSPQAGYKALLQVMKMLSIGVYTTDGKVVEHGVERSTSDFYLYDVELRSMAGMLDANRTYSLADLAGLLTRAGIQPDGQPVDPEILRQVLVGMVKEALAQPNDPGSVAPDLIRRLGLAQTPSYDLSQDPPLDQVRLDAVQFFLFEAELLVPVARQDAGTSAAARQAMAEPLSVSHAGCAPVTPETQKQAADARKAGKGMLGGLKKLLKWESKKGPLTQGWSRLSDALDRIKLVQEVLDMLHGFVLAGGIVAERLSNSLETHYGPAGHAPHAGDPIKFQIRVRMALDLGADRINCLTLAGYTIPKQGPIPGIPVRWDVKADNDITKYGTLDPAPGSFTVAGINFNFGSETTTDANGVATLTFTPKDEKGPPIGISTIDHGSVEGMVEWGNAFGNVFGKVNQYLTPISDVVGWNVGFHKPRGYTFDLTEHFTDKAVTHMPTSDVVANIPTSIEIVGHSCGDDPYSDPWTFQISRTVGTQTDGPSPLMMVTLDREGAWHLPNVPGNFLDQMAVNQAPGGEGSNSHATLLLTYSSPFEAQLHVVVSPATGTDANTDWSISPVDQTFTAPLEEDMSCPAP